MIVGCLEVMSRLTVVLFCSVQGRSNISEPVDEILQRDHLSEGYVAIHNIFFPNKLH